MTFLLFVNYRVSSVAFDGVPEELSTVKAQVLIRVDEIFSLSAVDRSANAMLQSLRRRGYQEAVVDPATDFRRETRSAEVTFYVTTGPRASVGQVRFEGSLEPYGEAGLGSLLDRRGGEMYSSGRMREWGEALRQRLVDAGHRAAEVRLENEAYVSETRTMNVTYQVDVGPVVVVELEGDRRRAVRRMLPRGKRTPYSEDDVPPPGAANEAL